MNRPSHPYLADPLDQQVARAAAGDRAAFAALVQRWQGPVFAFLGRMGLRQSEAEELAQEAFVRAWQNLGSYQRDKAAFSTWLFTIARRLALNELDRSERRWLVPADDHTPEAACDGPGPAQALQARQQGQALQAALRQVPAADRCVLALAYLNDLSLADVARIEGCSEAAAKARLHRARGQLRAAWQALHTGPAQAFTGVDLKE